jgi:hypothetical protein
MTLKDFCKRLLGYLLELEREDKTDRHASPEEAFSG